MDPTETLQDIIEHFPLYKVTSRLGVISQTNLAEIKPMNFFCAGICNSVQTFKLSSIDNNEPTEYKQNPQRIAMGEHVIQVGKKAYQITLKCQKCYSYTVTHIIAFEQTENGGKALTKIQKIGQLPSIEKTIDKDLKNWLSKTDALLYEKGLRCETNGFGIGAYGYFRRIVENNIEKILMNMSRLLYVEYYFHLYKLHHKYSLLIILLLYLIMQLHYLYLH
jgi:hypothetical protein